MSIATNERDSVLGEKPNSNSSNDLDYFEPPKFRRHLYFCTFVVALGGFINGFDAGAISSIFAMPEFNDRFIPSNRIDHYQGLLLAAFLTTNALSAFSAGFFCDKFSRKYSMAFAAFVYLIGIILQIIGLNFGLILTGRIIGGIGNGILTAAMPTYHSEIAPANIRGRIMGYITLSFNVGQLISFFFSFGTSYLSSNWSWRAPWFLHGITCLIFILLTLTLPFSPRWLIDQGRLEEAKVVIPKLLQLPLNHPLAIHEYDTIQEEILLEKSIGDRTYTELFQGTNLKRTLLSFFSSVGCSFTGSFSLMYFLPQIFQSTGLSDVSASIATTGGTGMLCLISAYVSLQWCVDRWGRRIVLWTGALVMAITLFVVAALFQVYMVVDDAGITISDSNARNTVIAMVYIYMGAYQYSWGTASVIYSVEVFNMRTRAKGLALSFGLSWGFIILLTYCTPLVMTHSPPGVFYFFAVCCTICFLGSLFIPETKGLSLEEMEFLFGVRK